MPALGPVGDVAARREQLEDALLARVVRDDSAPAVVLDAALNLVYANEACRRYGWAPDEVVGRNALEWIHPDDLPRAVAAARAVPAQAGFGTSPFRFRLPDGGYESLDVASVVLTGEDGTMGHIALSLRPNPFDRARTDAFRSMVAGEPPERSLAPLAAWFSPSRPASLLVFDGTADRTVVGDLDPALAGVIDGRQDHTPGAPWSIALEELTTVTIGSLDGLPSATVEAAAAQGLTAAAFVGSPDPGRPQGALLATWSSDPDLTALLAVNLGDIETLVRLALDRRASGERLEHLAHHDALTGLANRARFFTALEAAIGDRVAVAVAYLDLDGFKGVNDLHGHAAGDHLLVELADRFGREMRAGDLVARLGGDEFAVLVHRPPDEAAAATVVERLLAAARAPVELPDGAVVSIAASAGLTVVEAPDGADPDAIVHEADTALYEAKRSGKGALVLAGADHPTRRRDDP